MSDKRTYHGAAFPVPGDDLYHRNEGISVRVYLAAKAMEGMCRVISDAGNEPHYATVALRAVAMAEAMLEALERPTP